MCAKDAEKPIIVKEIANRKIGKSIKKFVPNMDIPKKSAQTDKFYVKSYSCVIAKYRKYILRQNSKYYIYVK